MKLHIDKQIQGKLGEDSALAYLRDAGLSLCERNFNCKGGEIDLIMQDGTVLVFVEVRKRKSMLYGGAAASITHAKKARLIIAAQVYLQRYPHPPACRFDVIAIDDGKISWLKDVIQH